MCVCVGGGGGGSHAKGVGGTTSFGVVLTREIQVLAILKGGGGKKFPPLKREGAESFTLSWGGGGAQ